MDSAAHHRSSATCTVCNRILWFNLPPEHMDGTPHYSSRKALESSAESCKLCALVLRAALSNCRDSRGIRYGTGYWRVFESISVQDDSGIQEVMSIKDMGSSAPEGETRYNALRPAAIYSGGPFATSFLRAMASESWACIASTGKTDERLRHLDTGEVLPALGLDDPDEDMPVWVYGNWWAVGPPGDVGEMSPMRLVGIGARFGRTPRIQDAYGSNDGDLHLRGSAIGVCTTDDSALFQHVPGRIRELDSSSDVAFRRIETWIQQCISTHEKCAPPALNPPLPSRVIDVDSSHGSVMLFESKGQTGRYTALSHSWGTSSRLTATKATLDDLKAGIALSSLPKTFRDAVEITRRLGIRYIWIDCLCIVQDDPRDWEVEAAYMGQVFQNAYVTISAASCEDSTSGCFPVRQRSSYTSVATRSLGYDTERNVTGPNSEVVDYEHDSRPGQRNRLHLFDEWLPGSMHPFPQPMIIGHFGKNFDPLENQPLSTRGWTLQERLLSPRTVHYATDQIYFECEQRILSEDGFPFTDLPYSLNALIGTQHCAFEQHGMDKNTGLSFVRGQYVGTQQPGLRWQGGWLALIENYSRRRLTVPLDKLSAISGVARVVAEHTDDRYFAGVWASHIYEDLMWGVYTHEESFDPDKGGVSGKVPVKGRLISHAVRPPEYRAPSWSWASIDAPIKFVPLSYSNLVAEVVDCYTKPAGNDEFGRVSEGELEIQAPIYEVFPYEPTPPWLYHGVPVKINLGDERGCCVGSVRLDYPDEPLHFPCYALFLDPAHAIILKAKNVELGLDADGREDLTQLMPKTILTSEDVRRNFRQDYSGHEYKVWIQGDDETDPDSKKRKLVEVHISAETDRQLREYWRETQKPLVHKALSNAVRIGIGEFVKERADVNPPGVGSANNDPTLQDEQKAEKIEHVKGDQSWGPITNEDPKVRITIF
ncbi:putative heterokaryon incompatibility protein [Corynascus novoguineensis]|uniref:Heterokaryon incompatibility protein n=1 Tax=Corynascus novoguineensis TaxID=1126955 RepID=A0AAN7HS04_9PEZI|nr:putative heterokaryon incompatibility protein [Corynascus novoguineensis]